MFFKVELIFIDVSSDCLCKRRHCKLFHFPHIKFPLVHFFKKLNLLDYIKLEIFLLTLSVSIFGQNCYRAEGRRLSCMHKTQTKQYETNLLHLFLS